MVAQKSEAPTSISSRLLPSRLACLAGPGLHRIASLMDFQGTLSLGAPATGQPSPSPSCCCFPLATMGGGEEERERERRLGSECFL